jgi:hypothetical protein
MTFEDPQRPRSTPIPDPSGSSTPRPPTPAQFIASAGQQTMPPPPPTSDQPRYQQPQYRQSFQQPQYQGQQYDPMAQIPMRTMSRIWIARTVIGLIIAIVGSVIAWRIVDSANKQVDRALDGISQQTIPAFTLPDITAPTGAVPATVPSTTPGTVPDRVSNLWEIATTRPLIDQLDQALPGDPTEFTMVVIYPDYAVAAAQNPDDPANTVGALWRNGAVGAGPAIPASDIDTHTFTEADVDWDAIGGLVAQAPQLLGAAGAVTHVIVERWDFDPALPMRILVYVEGAGYVEAGADGTVVGTH